MTEKEWLNCTDSIRMFKVFGDVYGPMRLDPRLRRFAVECCRRVRHLLTDQVFRAAADAGEAFADDPHNEKGTIPVMAKAALEGWRQMRRYEGSPDRHQVSAARAAVGTCGPTAWHAAFNTMRAAAQAANAADADRYDPSELGYQADLLRCIFGNPFRPLALSPAWCGTAVRHLAQFAYDNPQLPEGTLDTACLAWVADALEGAGCTDAEILGHLRSPGPHVRGCFAVDQILGRS